MGPCDDYRRALRDAADWASYLREHSGLPGPRANLELVQAVADEGDAARLDALIDTDDEYLVMCGVVGLGRLLAEGAEVVPRLRRHAMDSRWRVREAVAMALQRLGDADLPRLVDLASDWANDDHPLVQRAAVAGICEPRLLKDTAGASPSRPTRPPACQRFVPSKITPVRTSPGSPARTPRSPVSPSSCELRPSAAVRRTGGCRRPW